MTRAIVTVFGTGFLKPGPGTWGSLAAFPFAWLLHVLGGPVLIVCGTLVLFVLGLWATRDYMACTGRHDPSEVVVDEVVGQWIALLPVSFGAAHAGADIAALWPGALAAFFAFRLFDIWKPGPVGWADRREDALGVMLDDVVAGWLAALVVAVAAFVWHGLLGQ